MALKHECKTLKKIGKFEDIFVLRAQDNSAHKIIIEWIRENIDFLPERKVREAIECALRMRNYPTRKAPD